MEIKYGEKLKYKEICEIFNDEIYTRGNQRVNQLKRWNKDYEIIKEKTWYTILRERTDEEKQISNIRHYKGEEHHIRNKEKYKQFKINEKDRHSSGIYKIQLDNTIYIGQTNDFYNRFRHHYYNNFPTHDLLENGAIFSIVKKCNSQEERNILEEKYIKEYCEDNNYNCINKYFNDGFHKKTNSEYQNIKIKVKNDDYKKIMDFIKQNQINYSCI